MSSSIWAVVNAGGNSREKEEPDDFNAEACFKLTEQRFRDQADILAQGFIPSKGPRSQALKLRKGGRIAMLQGGGKQWRARYGSGEFMACGRIRGEVRPFREQDEIDFSAQCCLVRKYYPPHKPENELAGIILYYLHRAKRRLPKEDVHVRPMRGQKFIEVSPTHPGYYHLNKWWNENCRGKDTTSL